MKRYITALFLLMAWSRLLAQNADIVKNIDTRINPDLMRQEWDAHWITHPDILLKAYNVLHFRNDFTLASQPASFVIHVSADNRYRLFVNGEPVGLGPARGDQLHWRYETYDIAPYLQAGENVIAAVVWNFGAHSPVAQHSYRTSFIVQGNTEAEHIVNTNAEQWKVVKNEAYTPLTQGDFTVYGYYACGATDKVNGSLYPWGWEQADFITDDWLTPRQLTTGKPFGFAYGYGDGGVNLIPRNIPMMEEKNERFRSIARTEGITVDASFLEDEQPIEIPARSLVKILLDQSYLTMGYPELIVSGGEGSNIKITYAEALFGENRAKGNRNETESKQMVGYYDLFLPDGGAQRKFRPLWMRTYRYVELDIITAGEPLTLHDFYGIFTAYPFEVKGMFNSGNQLHQQIWDVGWRTARLCAAETYFDCPYYEQLQYVGDTRIQALISLYVAGDDRLMRNAIFQFNNSRSADGITTSRYPSGLAQYIPPYSLFWVAMVHDYHMHRNDPEFVQRFLPGVDAVLQWFERHLDDNHLLGGLPWWSYVDVTDDFQRGTPPGAEDGHSTLITLQYVYAMDYAVELFDFYGKKHSADYYRALSEKIKAAVMESSFDEGRGLLADTPEKQNFSQHTNIMAVLTNTFPEEEQQLIIQKVVEDASLTQCNIYYRFYLTRALQKVGMGDHFVNHLEMWEDMLAQGLTTFAEHEKNTRSDCHAWSASPNYEFLATVCGILPAEPHFSSVTIAPNLGELTSVEGKIPHPQGEIEVALKKGSSGTISGTVTLPEGVQGQFEWKGKSIPLKSGSQPISL